MKSPAGGESRWVSRLGLIVFLGWTCAASCRDYDLKPEMANGGATGTDSGLGGSGAGMAGETRNDGNADGGTSQFEQAGSGGVAGNNAGAALEVGGGCDGSLGHGAIGPNNGCANDGGGRGGGEAANEDGGLAPSEFAGLVLWLPVTAASCSRNEEDEVSHCQDLSGYGNDAVQSETFAAPTFIPETLTGHPTLRFDDEPSQLVVADDSSLQFGEGDFTWLVVARWRNHAVPSEGYTGYGLLVTKQYRYWPYSGIAMYANFPSPYNQPSMRRLGVQLEAVETVALSNSHRLNDDAFRLYVARRVGSTLEARINGNAESRTPILGPANIDAVSQPLIVGGYLGSPLRGDVSEMVILAGSVDEEDLVRLERALMEKHSLR